MTLVFNGTTGQVSVDSGTLKLGSDVELTNGSTIPAASLTGTVPSASLSSVPAANVTGTLPASGRPSHRSCS